MTLGFVYSFVNVLSRRLLFCQAEGLEMFVQVRDEKVDVLPRSFLDVLQYISRVLDSLVTSFPDLIVLVYQSHVESVEIVPEAIVLVQIPK